jgi:hypothetical protein
MAFLAKTFGFLGKDVRLAMLLGYKFTWRQVLKATLLKEGLGSATAPTYYVQKTDLLSPPSAGFFFFRLTESTY